MSGEYSRVPCVSVWPVAKNPLCCFGAAGAKLTDQTTLLLSMMAKVPSFLRSALQCLVAALRKF